MNQLQTNVLIEGHRANRKSKATHIHINRLWEMAKNDYQALAESSNPFIENTSHAHHGTTIGIDETTTDTENEDGNRENGIMIHVVPDTSKGMWV